MDKWIVDRREVLFGISCYKFILYCIEDWNISLKRFWRYRRWMVYRDDCILFVVYSNCKFLSYNFSEIFICISEKCSCRMISKSNQNVRFQKVNLTIKDIVTVFCCCFYMFSFRGETFHCLCKCHIRKVNSWDI